MHCETYRVNYRCACHQAIKLSTSRGVLLQPVPQGWWK